MLGLNSYFEIHEIQDITVFFALIFTHFLLTDDPGIFELLQNSILTSHKGSECFVIKQIYNIWQQIHVVMDNFLCTA